MLGVRSSHLSRCSWRPSDFLQRLLADWLHDAATTLTGQFSGLGLKDVTDAFVRMLMSIENEETVHSLAVIILRFPPSRIRWSGLTRTR